jgi:hypothetical protein
LPEKPNELGKRLVELSQARFDLQYKTFGVQEILDMLDLAHRLRMTAASLEDDADAQLTATQDLLHQIQQISATMDLRCQESTKPIIDRELARYRVQIAAAQVAEYSDDKTTAIECHKTAIAVAGELRRAVMLAYETGVLPPIDMLKLSRHSSDARIALINLTEEEAEQAKAGRVAAWEELAVLTDTVLEATRLSYTVGLVSFDELNTLICERFRIALQLAHEQDDHEGEVQAIRQILAAQRFQLERLSSTRNRTPDLISSGELHETEMQVKHSEAQLMELQATQGADELGEESAQMLQIQIANARKHRLMAELDEHRRRSIRLKLLWSKGGCHELNVIEAVVRERITELSLKQCRQGLAELQNTGNEDHSDHR